MKRDSWPPRGRDDLEAKIGQQSLETVVKMTLREEEIWNRVFHYVKAIFEGKNINLDERKSKESSKGVE